VEHPALDKSVGVPVAEKSFETELVTRVAPAMRSYAHSLAQRRRFDADDLIQQSLITAIRLLRDGAAPDDLDAWFREIVRKTASNMRQKEDSEPRSSSLHGLPEEAQPLSGWPGPERAAELVEADAAWKADSQRLSKVESEVIETHVMRGDTVAETAKQLNIPKGSIRWLTTGALRKLKFRGRISAIGRGMSLLPPFLWFRRIPERALVVGTACTVVLVSTVAIFSVAQGPDDVPRVAPSEVPLVDQATDYSAFVAEKVVELASPPLSGKADEVAQALVGQIAGPDPGAASSWTRPVSPEAEAVGSGTPEVDGGTSVSPDPKPTASKVIEDGMKIVRYADGTISRIYRVFEGKIHGIHWRFRKDGTTMEVADYSAGKLHGWCINYQADGSTPKWRRLFHHGDLILTEYFGDKPRIVYSSPR
jgi:RNA polymerase sigma factor (sigma-70 family)